MNFLFLLFLTLAYPLPQLCERITQLLTCQYDIALLLALLEFCLTLSETRPFLLVQSDGKILISTSAFFCFFKMGF